MNSVVHECNNPGTGRIAVYTHSSVDNAPGTLHRTLPDKENHNLLGRAIPVSRNKFDQRHAHAVDCIDNATPMQHEPWPEMSFVASLPLMKRVEFPCASGLSGQTCEKQQEEIQMTDCQLTPPSHGHASCDPSGSICEGIHSFPWPGHIQGSGKGGGSPHGRAIHEPLVDDERDRRWMRTAENRIHGRYTQKALDGSPGTCWGGGVR